jgi:hypothetical protein
VTTPLPGLTPGKSGPADGAADCSGLLFKKAKTERSGRKGKTQSYAEKNRFIHHLPFYFMHFSASLYFKAHLPLRTAFLPDLLRQNLVVSNALRA